MDCQDWTTVRRRNTKKDVITSGITSGITYGIAYGTTQDTTKNDKLHTVNPVDTYSFRPKRRVNSESLQALIRKRIEIKLTQEGADIMCAFPCNTFKNIESNRLIPGEEQIHHIQHKLNIQLKIDIT